MLLPLVIALIYVVNFSITALEYTVINLNLISRGQTLTSILQKHAYSIVTLVCHAVRYTFKTAKKDYNL